MAHKQECPMCKTPARRRGASLSRAVARCGLLCAAFELGVFVPAIDSGARARRAEVTVDPLVGRIATHFAYVAQSAGLDAFQSQQLPRPAAGVGTRVFCLF